MLATLKWRCLQSFSKELKEEEANIKILLKDLTLQMVLVWYERRSKARFIARNLLLEQRNQTGEGSQNGTYKPLVQEAEMTLLIILNDTRVVTT